MEILINPTLWEKPRKGKQSEEYNDKRRNGITENN